MHPQPPGSFNSILDLQEDYKSVWEGEVDFQFYPRFTLIVVVCSGQVLQAFNSILDLQIK